MSIFAPDENASSFSAQTETMSSQRINDVTTLNVSDVSATSSCGSAELDKLLLDECASQWFYFCTVVGGSICVFGFVANTVSIFVLQKDKQAPVASLLLQSLAVADNFFLFWWFLHISLHYLLLYAGYTNWSSFTWTWVRTFLYPFLFIGQLWTVWLTVFIALTRYFAVCRPYQAFWTRQKPIIARGIVALFVISFLYNTPRFLEYRLQRTGVCGHIIFLPADGLLHSNLYTSGYVDVMYYVFSFALPLVVLVYLNLHLMVAYKQVRQRRLRMLNPRENGADVTTRRHDVTASNQQGQAESYRDQNITLITIIIVLIFLVCHLPAKLVQIVFRYEHMQCDSVMFFLTE